MPEAIRRRHLPEVVGSFVMNLDDSGTVRAWQVPLVPRGVRAYKSGMKTRRLAMATLLSFLGFGAPAGALTVGDEAPVVSARNQDGVEVNLAEIYAKGPALVYFYPKADTSGCTAQACSLRDAFPDFSGAGLEILGVSGDSVEAQKKFAEKYQLPFTLLSDQDSVVAKAFGVPTMMGIPKRQSFLVSGGKIVWIVEKAKTKEHADEVKAALESLHLSKKS